MGRNRAHNDHGAVRYSIMNEAEKVNSLSSLKIICVFLLFWWHSPLTKPDIDIGARCCEFLFVTSGFLVAYNHARSFRSSAPVTWKECFKYLKKKLCLMWPLHILCFAVCALCDPSVFGTSFGVLNGILNAFLLQSWFGNPDIFFAFNGPAWFLSSLLFCYFLSPLLLRGLKTGKSTAFSFLFAITIRILLECFELSEYGEAAPVSIYVFPLVRAMEFYCGMTVYRLQSAINARISAHGSGARISPLFSAAEAAALAASLVFIISFNDVWIRGCYVLMFCFVVLVFSFDGGIISDLIGGTSEHSFPAALLLGLERYEFEIFMLHKTVLIVVSSALSRSGADAVRVTLISLVVTLVLAVLWKKYLGKRSAKAMYRLLRRAESYLGYKI